MDALPIELLTNIAAELNSTTDVKAFRLVNRRHATAGYPSLVHHIRVLNTTNYISLVQDLCESRWGSLGATKQLTLYHGTWPRFDTYRSWRLDSSFCVIRSEENKEPTTSQHAYQEYLKFIATEDSRDLESDTKRFRGLLQQVPQLESITVSQIGPWTWRRLEHPHLIALRETIGLRPIFNKSITKTISALLPLLNALPKVKKLSTRGALDTAGLPRGVQYPHIRELDISPLRVSRELQTSIQTFLMSFPNLESLSIRALPGCGWVQFSPLPKLQWSQLHKLSLSWLWTREDDLFDFVDRHELQSLCLNEVTFFEGTWKSFFMRLRALGKALDLCICGLLTVSAAEQDVTVDDRKEGLIQRFLDDKEMPWPFAESRLYEYVGESDEYL